MSEKRAQTIRVWTGDCDLRKASPNLIGERIYATRQAHIFPDGRRVAVPNTWELLSDKKYERRAGRFYFPEFELEPTAEDGAQGIQLYACVQYDRQGREESMEGGAFTLPAALGPEAHFYDITAHDLALHG